MSKGVVFWILMIIAFVFGILGHRNASGPNAPRIEIGNSVLLFVLLFILGWQVFGFVIR